MTIEDAVEDYLIYAYFELDHPRRCYVGKTLQSRAEQRDQEHRSGDSGAKKFNAFVKNDIIFGNRDFNDVLRYKILEHFTGTAKECAEREGEHIQRKNSIENGWNLKPEGTGNGLLFPSTTPGGHKNRPQIRRSKLHIQGDLVKEIIQDVIEFGLEQSILEKDKEYNFQELKMLIAKSYVAHANQTLNLTYQEPAPDEIKSVLNDWTKLENRWRIKAMIWWEKQLTKSGFERPLDWNVILKTICQLFEKAELNSPLIQWLEGNRAVLNLKSLPELNRKWVCYGGSADVWLLIRSKYLAEYPNTLQEIKEKEEQKRREKEERERQARLQRVKEAQERIRKGREKQELQEWIRKKREEAARIQREREEQARLQKEKEEKEEAIYSPWDALIEELSLQKGMEEHERPTHAGIYACQSVLQKEMEMEEHERRMEEKEEAIGKVAERKEKERIQREPQAKPDLAIVEKQVTRAGSGGCGCIIFSIISIIFIICVLVSCIEERTDKRERTKSEMPFACQQYMFETDVSVEWDKHKENNPGHFLR